MDDVLTETPPPSRFFDDDLDNFAIAPPPLPSPFLLLNPNPKPNLLIVAISPLSRSILHHLPSKTLIGSLFLPEIALSGNPLVPSPNDKSFNVYSVGDQNSCLASVQYNVSPERCRAVAKCLIGDVKPDQVVIFDSIKSQNYRGRIEVDETLAFKLETKQQRLEKGNLGLSGVDYLPSGSVMDGLGAAILTESQMKGIKGTLVATWPENGGIEVLKMVFKQFGFDVGRIEGGFSKVTSRADLDLYI
ncbi:Proteasome assembly chaperone 1 [Rhynchospora pubera]|uniref:Proteasome assembly chaperone 1 n=1 Tax=Rhynchospora pubera TaxID=906938 RepID=A0AAV8CDJ4_9POAL|nr:Proteasome assembly chaperone 1 [Rhynchospora pubera]KAJ4794626.1 Proteasome assembly chaperone 1 [Rhynchospora pubera]KAJ4818464.1 Proteasome assembly chaperone 1 [Rhynchospora pubera]